MTNTLNRVDLLV